MKLYRDAHGVVVGTQAEAKRMGKGWTAFEVPVDKQGLIDWLNAQEPAVTLHEQPVDPTWPTPLEVFDETRRDRIIMDPQPTATRAPLSRDRVCEAVSDYNGTDLGYVALEVAARFTCLAKGKA